MNHCNKKNTMSNIFRIKLGGWRVVACNVICIEIHVSRHVAELQLARDVCWVQNHLFVFIVSFPSNLFPHAFCGIFFLLLSSKTVLSFSCLRVTKCRPTCIAQIEWNCFTAAFVCLRQENQHKKALGVPQSKVSSRSFILMNRWRKTKKIAITTQARIWDKDVKKIMKKSDFSSSPNQNT